MKRVGLILFVKRYEPLVRRQVSEFTFLQIEITWSSKFSLLSMITPKSLNVLTNLMLLSLKVMNLWCLMLIFRSLLSAMFLERGDEEKCIAWVFFQFMSNLLFKSHSSTKIRSFQSPWLLRQYDTRSKTLSCHQHKENSLILFGEN